MLSLKFIFALFVTSSLLTAQRDNTGRINSYERKKAESCICYKPVKHSVQIIADTSGTALFEMKKGMLKFPVPDVDSLFDGDGVVFYSAPLAPVFSVAGGKVTRVAKLNDDYLVILRHGLYLTAYAHLDSVAVSEGELVTAGQKLGLVSNRETELDFQIWKSQTKLVAIDWFNPDYVRKIKVSTSNGCMAPVTH